MWCSSYILQPSLVFDFATLILVVLSLLNMTSILMTSCCYLLGHGTHRAGNRGQIVTTEVDLCQGGDVADGQGELTKVVVGQVKAPQTRKPATTNEKKMCDNLAREHRIFSFVKKQTNKEKHARPWTQPNIKPSQSDYWAKALVVSQEYRKGKGNANIKLRSTETSI